MFPRRIYHTRAQFRNNTLRGIRLLEGIECDILDDGSPDLDDDVINSRSLSDLKELLKGS